LNLTSAVWNFLFSNRLRPMDLLSWHERGFPALRNRDGLSAATSLTLLVFGKLEKNINGNDGKDTEM